MKVTITQQHIDQGKRNKVYDCPLALALRDASGQLYYVGYSHYWIKGESRQQPSPRLSNEALEFIGRFDIGDVVAPCEIEMDAQ